jgi:hypothetical protein
MREVEDGLHTYLRFPRPALPDMLDGVAFELCGGTGDSN